MPEELQTIVGVLDNQLRLCSMPKNGNIKSCEPLLARAKVLCAHLEARGKAVRSNKERRITAVTSAAMRPFPFSARAVIAKQMRGMPPRRSQRVAVSM